MVSRIALIALSFVAVAAACGTPVTAEPDVVIVVAGGDCEGQDACAFDFGSVAVAHTATNVFTIKNNGAVAADIKNVAIIGDATFTVQSENGTTVAAKGTTSATVAYSPTAQSTSNGSLEVTWGDDSQKTSVKLTGRGL